MRLSFFSVNPPGLQDIFVTRKLLKSCVVLMHDTLAILTAILALLFPLNEFAIERYALGFASFAVDDVVGGKSLVEACDKGLAYTSYLLVDRVFVWVCGILNAL